MMLKITDNCSANCSHCMSNCEPGSDKMMNWSTLDNFFNFLSSLKNLKLSTLVVTGGEPTEHPEFVNMLKRIVSDHEVRKVFGSITVASNGFWVLDNESAAMNLVNEAAYKFHMPLMFQCSTDSRFYKKKLPSHKRIWREPGFEYCPECVIQLYPMGKGKDLYDSGVRVGNRVSPHCYNLRAAAKQLSRLSNNFNCEYLLSWMDNSGKVCTPSINWDGTVSLGESSLCPHLLSVNGLTGEKLLNAALSANCNVCAWMLEPLPQEYKDLF